jgi:DNA-binding transcriptional MerR regulator
MEKPTSYTLDYIEKETGFDKRTIAYYVQEGLVPKVGRRGPKTRYPQPFLDRLLFVRMIRQQQDAGELGQLTLKEIRAILDRIPAETVAEVAAGNAPFTIEEFAAEPAPETPSESTPEEDSPEPVLSMASARDRISAMDRRFAPMRAEVQDDPDAAVSAFDQVAESVPAVAANSNAAAEPQFLLGPVPEIGGKDTLPRAVRYEDTIKQPEEEEVEPEPVEEEGSNGFPDISKHDRLGWSLARLQRALSNVPRRRSGNTESWHRARITPELTISARNLADVDAHLLDSVSRMLKQLLWEAWEE